MILHDYEIVVIADDSSSMTSLAVPPRLIQPGRQQPTRWHELQDTLGLIVKLGNCFDASGIDIYFLNRPKLLNVKSTHDPRLVKAFKAQPGGTTPLTETVRTLAKEISSKKPILLFILADGEPNGGADAFCQELDNLVNKRSTRTTFKVQIMACTGDDEAVGYLDELDKRLSALDCSDYYTEKEQVLQSGRTQNFTLADWSLKATLAPVSQAVDQWEETHPGEPVSAPPLTTEAASGAGTAPYAAGPHGAAVVPHVGGHHAKLMSR